MSSQLSAWEGFHFDLLFGALLITMYRIIQWWLKAIPWCSCWHWNDCAQQILELQAKPTLQTQLGVYRSTYKSKQLILFDIFSSCHPILGTTSRHWVCILTRVYQEWLSNNETWSALIESSRFSVTNLSEDTIAFRTVCRSCKNVQIPRRSRKKM